MVAHFTPGRLCRNDITGAEGGEGRGAAIEKDVGVERDGGEHAGTGGGDEEGGEVVGEEDGGRE
jgi:hypothetical protein